MSYQAISLKYRPQTLDEVVGQERVVQGLKAAIQKKAVHHAYLFSGPRGVGKTSTARILAKSLNCTDGPTVTPCGICAHCKEIKDGRNIDVIEIDGASNRGIDEVRTLRENVKFSPVNSAYKIYIIDEVHMLTEPAFNALLKTLEEPPDHVRFILATTHLHKLPPTILSRCQKFSFALVSASAIVDRLKKIAAAEQISIRDPKILFGIAKASGGSIRDAESIFDQILPVVSSPDFAKHMYSFLGMVEETVLSNLSLCLSEKDAAGALQQVQQLYNDGKDLSEVARDFIEYLRNILLCKIDVSLLDTLELSQESKDLLFKYAGQFTEERLIRAIEEIIDAQRKAKSTLSLQIPFEVALIKLCGNTEQMAAAARKPDTTVSKPVPAAEGAPSPAQPDKPAGSSPKPITQAAPAAPARSPFIAKQVLPPKGDAALMKKSPFIPAAEKTKDVLSPAAVADESAGAIDEQSLRDLKHQWLSLANKIKSKSILLGSYLQKADVCSVKANTVTCAFPQNLSFHKEHLEEKENMRLLESLLKEFLQREVKLRFVLTNSTDQAMENYQKKNKQKDAVEKDMAMIQDIMNEFQGKIVKEDA